MQKELSKSIILLGLHYNLSQPLGRYIYIKGDTEKAVWRMLTNYAMMFAPQGSSCMIDIDDVSRILPTVGTQ